MIIIIIVQPTIITMNRILYPDNHTMMYNHHDFNYYHHHQHDHDTHQCRWFSTMATMACCTFFCSALSWAGISLPGYHFDDYGDDSEDDDFIECVGYQDADGCDDNDYNVDSGSWY